MTKRLIPMALPWLLFLPFLAAEADADSPPTNPPAGTLTGTPIPLPGPSTGGPVIGNLVLNGDFEVNFEVGCHFNLSNIDIPLFLADMTAFGAGEEIDFMNEEAGCDFGLPPQSGNAKLGLANRDPDELPDAFSLDLAEPLIAGATYQLRFFAHAVIEPFSTEVIDVLVGVSEDPSDFGQEIIRSTPETDQWTEFNLTFVSPINASVLTVMSQIDGDGWNHVDNFSLVRLPDALEIPTSSTIGLVALIALLAAAGTVTLRRR